jgi:hypothetical protein
LKADISGDDAADGVVLRFKEDGHIFNPKRLQSGDVLRCLLLDLLYADGMCAMAHSESALQRFMTRLARATQLFGLVISTAKTEVMVVSPRGLMMKQPTIRMLDGAVLKVVPSFKYLGGILTDDNTLDREITSRIAQANLCFGRLDKRVWRQRFVSVRTKMLFYTASVLSVLLYGCETWATLRKHLVKLEAFHMSCLRRILHIKWMDKVSNVEILARTGLMRMETIIRFAGYNGLVTWSVWGQNEFRTGCCMVISGIVEGVMELVGSEGVSGNGGKMY